MDNDYNQDSQYNEYNRYNEEPMLNEANEAPYEYAEPVPMVSFGGLPPAIEVVKSAGRSVPFLIATICVTLSVLFTFLNAGLTGLSMRKLVLEGVSASEQPMFIAVYNISFIVTVALAMLPMILMFVGMWVIVADSRKNTPTMKGLGACRAAIIIWNVCLWIALVFTVILGIASIALLAAYAEELSYYLEIDSAGMVIVFAAIIFAVLLIYEILVLVYFAKMLKTTRVVKDIVMYGFSKKKVSVYLIVINFLLILGTFFSLASSAIANVLMNQLYAMSWGGLEMDGALSEIFAVTGTTGITAASQVIGIVTLICVNIVLIRLSGKLKQIFRY